MSPGKAVPVGMAGADDPVLVFARSGGRSGAAASLRKAALADPRIRALAAELETWPGPAIASHKSSKQLFHKLSFLADCGFGAGDFPRTIDRILSARCPDGILSLTMNIGKAHGGSGTDSAAWALCDAPVTTWALAAMGMAQDPRVLASVAGIAALAGDVGWPCAVSASLGSWRGPGKKSDPCPFATLASLRMLSPYEGYEAEKKAGIECLLGLWERSRTDHPYIFHMGTDFRKLKAPLFWYDLLCVVDVLSRHPAAVRDARYKDMLALALGKRTEGGFVPESAYLDWKDWDFGQKKKPSAWLDLYVDRIRSRSGT